MTRLNNVTWGLIISLATTFLIGIVGWQTGLFWDNVLFVNDMSAPLTEFGPLAWGKIPTSYDPGHPPFIATYCTIVWKLFGRSLSITHIALYPFIFLFCFELWQITHILFKQYKWTLAAYCLVLADASVFSQLMYIGTEVFILCFSSIAIWGILSESKTHKTIGLMLLGITSLRGMMLCFGIFLWDLCRWLWIENYSLRSFLQLRNISTYIIGAIPAILFLSWRLIVFGWIISNPLHPWGSAWEFEGVTDFLHNFIRNSVVLSWRILDFNRWVPILCIAIITWRHRQQIKQDKQSLTLLAFCSLCCSVVAGTSLHIRNPMGHSYYLLIYVGVGLLFISLLKFVNHSRWIYTLVICSLLASNCIVYPDKISQGWPCSLASLPYWSLRKTMLNEIDQRNIPMDKVFTFFPFGSCADDVDLSGDKRPYANSIEEADYMIASNISNLDDDTLDAIQHYKLVTGLKKGGVWMNLYRLTP